MVTSMQYKQTPPIQYIPVFDAAARHLSFKKAAMELCVTAPAVGQQIKAFEHWLGKPLFNRHTRSLSLTDEGKYYMGIAQEIMEAHSNGFAKYSRHFRKSSLHLSAPLFIAQELIMPNYLEFEKFVPGTELRMEARMSYVDFDTESIDAAIRFGNGNWPDLNCKQLSKAYVSPVCSPDYAASHPISNLSDLANHRLIYAAPEMSNWGAFFWKSGTQQAHENIVCDSYLAALKAASDGLGVALGIFPTANKWVNNGLLELPLPIQIPIDKSYWFVTPKTEHANQEINELYSWLKTIFNKLPALERPLMSIDPKSLQMNTRF